MSTATLERPAASAQALVPAVRHALRARREARPRSRVPAAPSRTLFVVPFRSAMTAADAARLTAVAGLDCDLVPKLRGTTVSAAVRRLDFWSGLFLARGGADGEWRLECRTWGTPAPGAVRRWQLHATAAARALDPDVSPACAQEVRT